MKKLKIAQIAPINERIPPKKYGGIERVVHDLTEELVKRGHDVTLFATGDSKTSAKLSSVYPRALREAKIKDVHGLIEWTLLHLGSAYKKQESFDIIHDHNTIFSMPLAHFAKTPTVITIHGPIRPSNKRLFQTLQNPYFVSVSNSQIENEHNLKIAATIYNGLNMSRYPFKLKDKGYLLFVGRISMEKGVHHAIDVAQDLNLPLVIAAKLDKNDMQYFNEYIEPRLYSDQVMWIGEVDEKQRNELMSSAICLLNPLVWKEPFGLTMIEAMACGSPVIAFDSGSVREIIVDKKTGYIVDDVEEMIYAVAKINKINRLDCRTHALKNFNAKLMTDKYEKLYYEILESKK